MRTDFISTHSRAAVIVRRRSPLAASVWKIRIRAAFFAWTLLGLNLAALPAPTRGAYHTYESMTGALQAFAASYPSLSRLESIGKSEQGRDIWCLRISDHPQVLEAEPSIAYLSTVHGNEPVGLEMSLNFINLLLTNYGTDGRISQLVDNVDLSIVPLWNPDGFVAGTRGNAFGYDLNRSFPEGSPPNNFGNVLTGPPMDLVGRPAEVRSVMQWMADNRFTLSANFHTGALVVNYPYDNDGKGSVYSACPDDALYRQISETYSSHNAPMWNSPYFEHGITNGADWYAINGGLQDWTYRYLGGNAVTIELSDTFKPPASQLPTLWSQNQESMLSFAETCQMGVHGLLTDLGTGLPLAGAVQITGQTRQAFSNPEQGFFDYMLLPGDYSLTFTAPGYVPRSFSGVTIPAGVGIELNVPLMPVPEPGSVIWNGGSGAGPTNWGLAANWDLGSVPDGPGAKVVFGNQAPDNHVVDMISVGRTVGSIAFVSFTGATIQSSGGFNLTLDNGGGTSLISVEGSHTITAPLILGNDATVAGGGMLNLSGGVTGNHALNVFANLTATSIQASALNIGGARAMQAVPEPSAFILLGVGATVWFCNAGRRRKHER